LLASQVVARDTSTDSTYPPASGSPTIATANIYSSPDAYFLQQTTVTNPYGSNHVAQVARDPATGNILSKQEIQSVPATQYAYDAFGRLSSESPPGGQTILHRLLAWGAGNVVLKHWSWQPGTPVEVDYIDKVGRTIAHGETGFDGNEVITETAYNERGATVAKYEPMSINNSAIGSWDGVTSSQWVTAYSNIDVLGRVGQKLVHRSNSAFASPTAGNADFLTTYTYSSDSQLGVTATIKAYTPTILSGVITMSRTYDPLGKLVQTVQNVSSATAPITTRYGWDAAGNLISITDVNNHSIVSTYDDLGRKTAVNDPDRGNWQYTWDGLGRVRTQLDANGTMLAYEYDVFGRMERRFMRKSGVPSYNLEANWAYDAGTAIGALASLSGVVDTIDGSLTSTADKFIRSFAYDSFLRPTTVTTHIPGGSVAGGSWTAHDFVTETAYDANVNRPKAALYPGGEAAYFDYDQYGVPTGESVLNADGTRGASYRSVTGMTARRQVTAQTFGNLVAEATQYDGVAPVKSDRLAG
jgi:YD repeat-containing protein